MINDLHISKFFRDKEVCIDEDENKLDKNSKDLSNHKEEP